MITDNDAGCTKTALVKTKPTLEQNLASETVTPSFYV